MFTAATQRYLIQTNRLRKHSLPQRLISDRFHDPFNRVETQLLDSTRQSSAAIRLRVLDHPPVHHALLPALLAHIHKGPTLPLRKPGRRRLVRRPVDHLCCTSGRNHTPTDEVRVDRVDRKVIGNGTRRWKQLQRQEVEDLHNKP